MAKFNVGDRVEVVNAGVGIFYPNGAIGTVEEIDHDGDCWIDFDPHPDIMQRANGSRTWCVVPERLRLLHAAPVLTLRARLRALPWPVPFVVLVVAWAKVVIEVAS